MTNQRRLNTFLSTGKLPEMTAMDAAIADYNRRVAEDAKGNGKNKGLGKKTKATTLAEHDRRFHPDGFDPETDTCGLRDDLASRDPVDTSLSGASAAKPKVDDAAYMDAVNRGDMATASRMVCEAAARSMPDTKVVGYDGMPLVVYHNSHATWSVYDGKHIWAWRDYTGPGSSWNFGQNQYNLFMNLNNPFEWDADYQREEDLDFSEYSGNKNDSASGVVAWARGNGYDGVIIRNIKEFSDRVEGDDFVAFNSTQVKSADPVTYDDDGNVIPLSRRFDFTNPDIRY